MDHFQNFSESYFEGWSNMKWLFFILVKFWFIDDIIIWFPGKGGGQDMQIIKWLFTWKIIWFRCIVSLGMLSLAQVKWIKCHHLDLWSYDNGVRVRAETTELEMARGKISARPSESYGEHHLLRSTKNKKSSGCFFKGGGAQKTEIMKIVSIRSLRVLHLNRRWQLNFPWKCMLDLYPSNSNDRFFFRLYSYESSWPLFYLFKLNSYQVHKWGEMELGRLGLKNGSIVYLRSQICFALWKLTDCQAGDDYVMWNNRHSQIYFS